MSHGRASSVLGLRWLMATAAGMAAAGGMQQSGAQPAEVTEADEVIVVTGSHIPRSEFSSVSPIEVITADTAMMQGLIDTGDILQNSSIASGSIQPNNRFSAWVIEGGVGNQPISLRGLGPQRSLVLLNGKRPGPAGTRGQVSGFDLNVIPAAAVQRFEIFKDGASTIYGSDAVAGVVNIITRTSVDGPEITFDYTMPAESGGESYSISGATGFDFDRGNIVVSGQVQQRDAIRLADRDYLSCQQHLITDASGNRLDWEDRSILAGTPYEQCLNLYANTFFDGIFETRYIESQDGATDGPVAGYRPRTNGWYDTDGNAWYDDQRFFPQANSTTIQNETTRTSLYLSTDFDYDVLGGANWRNDLLLNQRETSFDGWRQFFPLVGSADIPILAAFGLPTDFFAYPNDPGYENGFGDTLAQPVIPYPQNGSAKVDYISWSTTLSGEFDQKLAGWGWSLSAVYSESEGEYRSNSIRKSTSGDIFFDANAPAFDYMSPEVLRGDYGADFIETIGMNTLGRTTYEQYTINGLMSGHIASLPAGDVALAVGFEYRDHSINDVPDQASQDDDLWNETSAQITTGDDNVTELFAEFELPLIADKRGVQDLTLNVSGRAFDYDSYGSDSVWKAGVNWQVMPVLRFRATRGTSYRAPALYELFLGGQTSFLDQFLIDPCIDWGSSTNANLQANCAAAGIPSDFGGGASAALVRSGGGAGLLEAETSESTTFGIVLTPPSGNISVAVDYFKIDIDDEVAQLGPDAILNGCYAASVYPNAFCGLFARDPGNVPTSLDAFGIIEVDDSYLNVNNQVAEGWDLAVRYTRDLPIGVFLLEAQGTYTLVDRVKLFDPMLASGFDTDDFNGTIGEPTFTSNIRFALSRNDWTFNWFVDFINGMDNSVIDDVSFDYFGFADARRIVTTPSVRYHDVSARWQGDGISVVFGVSNITDEEPPFVSDGLTPRYGNIPTFATQYDLMGRAGFMSVTRSF